MSDMANPEGTEPCDTQSNEECEQEREIEGDLARARERRKRVHVVSVEVTLSSLFGRHGLPEFL